MPALNELAVGEIADKLPYIRARNYWNTSGLKLVAGQSYGFRVTNFKHWRDWCIQSNPQDGHIDPKWWTKWLGWPPAKWFRRYRGANLYTLVGTPGKHPHEYFLIGEKRTYTPKRTGELCTFANDLYGFYWNNYGTLRLVVTRLS